jgi:hypothetical protein
MSGRRYRVRVWAKYGEAMVVLRRPFEAHGEHILVARINLARDDAEDRLADARARATTLAHQVNGLERDRP